MKNIKNLFSVCFALTTISATAFSQTQSFQAHEAYKATEQFLYNLGFEDYVQKAEKTLSTEKNLDVVSEAALKKVTVYYKQIDSVKNIAALTGLLLEGISCRQEKKCLERNMVVKMVAQQAQSFPLISLEPFSNVAQQKYRVLIGEKASDFRQDYLENRGVERYQLEKTNILKILKYLALRQNLLKTPNDVEFFEKFTDDHLHEILEPNYMANSRQQNRHLGRALTAVYMRWAKANQCSECITDLKNEFDRQDIQIEQIIGGNYRMKNDEMDRLVQLKSGDLALEYSSGGQAYLISMGLEPIDMDDYKIAEENKLINNYQKMPIVLMNTGYSHSKNRIKQNFELTDSDQRIMQMYWDPNMSKGFSHVGLVEVKKDPATGISLAWIWDIYPQGDRLGVVRPMSPEGFAYSERFIRIGFSRYNPEKLRQKFIAQKQSRGFLPIVWKSSGSKMAVKEDKRMIQPISKKGREQAKNDRIVPLIDPTQTYEWPSMITQTELDELVKKSQTLQGEEWFNQVALPRVFSQVRQYIYGPQALVFAKDLVNAKSMAYCSQFVALSFLQSLNFDLQTKADQYRTLPQIAGTLMPSMLSQDLKERIIAPAGLVWQSDATEMVVQMNFHRTKLQKQQEILPNWQTVAQKYHSLTEIYGLDKVVDIQKSLKQIDKERVDNDDDEE